MPGEDSLFVLGRVATPRLCTLFHVVDWGRKRWPRGRQTSTACRRCTLQDAFVGREAVATYFDKIATLVPADIKFVVEDITDGDPRKVGVRW